MYVNVQRSNKLLEGPVSSKRAVPCRTAAGRPNFSAISRPKAWQDESPSIEITEAQTDYKIIVPLSGIDPRKIYLFATPRSLLIEIRSKSTVCHELPGATATEKIDHRISRELTLPAGIKQGGTTVELRGASLLITARKSDCEQPAPWSQLIHFDTRAGLGLI